MERKIACFFLCVAVCMLSLVALRNDDNDSMLRYCQAAYDRENCTALFVVRWQDVRNEAFGASVRV